MPKSIDYLRGEATIDPNRYRNPGKFNQKIFIVQCSECGLWRVVLTSNIPNYKFKCFNSSCRLSQSCRKVKGTNFYNFNFHECSNQKEAELRVKTLNDGLR